MATIDHFEPSHARPFVAYDRAEADKLFGVLERVAQLLRIEIEGMEHLPEGRGILVANHAFGWDVAFVMARIWHDRRRTVWALGEHAWWKFPFLRKIAATVGTVDGTPENADALLARDQLLIVLPGGLREAVKPRDLRYRLLWGHRYGFVRAAMRNQAPLVPVASIGTDDLFDFVGNAYRRGERWLRNPAIPIPLPKRILPIPHLVQVRFVIGEPIEPPPDPRLADDDKAVRRLRREVEGALHEIIEVELARRVGIDLT